MIKKQSQLLGCASLASQPSNNSKRPEDTDKEEEGGGGGRGGGLAEKEEKDNNNNNNNNAIKDQIAQKIQNWCEDVKKRRLQLLKKVLVAKLDLWL
jgi:hypothetical protein